MRLPKRKIAFGLFMAAIMGGLWSSGLREAVTLERIKEQRDVLHAFVQEHYLVSVLSFILLTLSTAFMVPGAIILILAGGFFFGVVPGLFFSVTGLTLGAVTAFLTARYILGGWVQEKYRVPLGAFNEEIHRHGHYYLITLRIVPILPFFLVNILAGLTTISLQRFASSTFMGLLPAAFVFSFAGRRLAVINSPRDIFSPGMIAALLLLAILALLPVILKSFGRLREKYRA